MEPLDARIRLDEERVRLEGVRDDLARVHDESERESLEELSSMDQHPADTGTETFDRERDLSLLEQVEAELVEVEHALSRIDNDTYGTCEACGQPIGAERLEALPMARFCLNDQSQAEAEAARALTDVAHARRGPDPA